MNKLKIVGPYKTGVRTFRISELMATPEGVEYDAQILCFYPIAKNEYFAKERKGQAKFQTFKDVYGMQGRMENFYAAVQAAIKPPCFEEGTNEERIDEEGPGILNSAYYRILQYLIVPVLNYEIPAFKDAELTPDFKESDTERGKSSKLRPIFLQPSMLGNAATYTASCMTFASQGYVVFAIQTQNGSGVFAFDAEKKVLPFNMKHGGGGMKEMLVEGAAPPIQDSE